MLAILNSLNAHNFPIFQPIFMILVSKFMVHRVLSDNIYFILGLLSPLNSLRKRKKCSASLAFYLFSSTRLINSV